ncbi:MAG: DUF362 domain-containing protein [Desulfatiglans sp.]|jgi:uncharacterized protein (DUF362 family)/Pyruvate/2-oxoacid:ferredoxin oxidoreductase delta subunit|nr:DUF362 domain-containing protein [Desulfatiglans sp.]
MSRVLIVDTDENRLQDAVKEVFDFFTPDLKGKKVLIKPNMLGETKVETRSSTSPHVLKEVVKQVETQTKNIVVGDCPMRLESRHGADTAGRVTGIQEAGLGYFKNIAKNVKMTSVGSEIIPICPLPVDYLEADAIINVPIFKTHQLAGITCCIKNMFGIVAGDYKPRTHSDAGHPKRLAQFFVDIYRFKTPVLNIVDATYGMEGHGPNLGTPRKINKIIAGTNGVEVDAVVAVMQGYDPDKLKSLQLAARQGLGSIHVDEIDIVGNLEVLEDWQLPTSYTPGTPPPSPEKLEEIKLAWHELGYTPPSLDEKSCNGCGECVECCPTDAISLNTNPSIDPDKCVSCFSCAEVCPETALYFPEDKAQRLYKVLFE